MDFTKDFMMNPCFLLFFCLIGSTLISNMIFYSMDLSIPTYVALDEVDVFSETDLQVTPKPTLPPSSIVTESESESEANRYMELLQQCKKETAEQSKLDHFQNINQAMKDFHRTYEATSDVNPAWRVNTYRYSSGSKKTILKNICVSAGGLFVEQRNPIICSATVPAKVVNKYVGDSDCIAHTDACRALDADYALEWYQDLFKKHGKCSYEKEEFSNDPPAMKKSSQPPIPLDDMEELENTYHQCWDERRVMLSKNPELGEAEKLFLATINSHSDSTSTSYVSTFTYSSKAEKLVYQKACSDAGGHFAEAPKPISCTGVSSGTQQLIVMTRKGLGYCIPDTNACRFLGVDYAVVGWNDWYVNHNEDGKECHYVYEEKTTQHQGLRGTREIIQLSTK